MLILFSVVNAQIDTTYYYSDNEQNKIICIYDSTSIGKFYNNSLETGNIILEEYLKYGPLVKFLSNNIVELKVPTGSPNYHCYYYSFEGNKISHSFNLPIAYDITNNLVAVLDMYSLKIYDVFTKKEKYSFEDDLIEPMSLLVFGNPEAKFIGNKFLVKYKYDKQVIEREYYLE
jgi:hypothetical protein